MSTAEAPLRKPSLSDTFADIDRRVRAVEFGDPHALREQLGNLEERIHDYVDYLLGTVMNDLYSNDTGVYNWCVAYAMNVNSWAVVTLQNWSKDFIEYWVRMHEQSYHGLPNTIPGPGALPGPVIPPWWTVTYPDIPDLASDTATRTASFTAEIAARTEAVTAEIIAAHEQDHPAPEEHRHE